MEKTGLTLGEIAIMLFGEETFLNGFTGDQFSCQNSIEEFFTNNQC